MAHVAPQRLEPDVRGIPRRGILRVPADESPRVARQQPSGPATR